MQKTRHEEHLQEVLQEKRVEWDGEAETALDTLRRDMVGRVLLRCVAVCCVQCVELWACRVCERSV